MEYEHFTTFVKLSTMGVEDASSTLTEQDLDRAIERAAAERPEEWWERYGPVRRDGLNAEISFGSLFGSLWSQIEAAHPRL